MAPPHGDESKLLEQVKDFFAKYETSKKDQKVFTDLYRKFLMENAHIDWNSWKHISEDVQKDAKNLPPFDGSRNDVLKRLAVVKLNGGLGTTMGCDEPKSFIVLRDGLSFLEIAIKQHQKCNEKYNSSVPLYLMNSFYTNRSTQEKLREMGVEDDVQCFEQSKCPRIFKDSLLPVGDAEWGDDAWCPPGHGNIFEALSNTGTLQKLLDEGRDILFVSNIDNTGATLDLSIAQFMADSSLEYVMECTNKTQNDIKGGTLIEISNRLMHLEIPQVPPEHLDDFCSTKVFKIFNTNNIWVNLKAVKANLSDIKSEIIVNHKTVRGRQVIQLETSIGGCIRNFEKAYCVHVDRSRFRPVKRVEDLVCMSSNLFEITPDFTFCLVAPQVPTIDLGKFYQKVANKDKRMPKVPKFSNASSFVIEGDVAFEGDVTIKGDVSIINKKEKQEIIPAGAVLDNEKRNLE
ncbi:unnamed protein product [Caenorhabditis auriculariae]|uniref:UTP--glucose-1-phosphate uridylyltransferase n=1 Tax=Caenorhabditis auriculariae TaxID=2777116 RepID=A0A8S1H1T5_9PELO|nr:unnamed protein product [Caenorhabditis auriculariae]